MSNSLSLVRYLVTGPISNPNASRASTTRSVYGALAMLLVLASGILPGATISAFAQDSEVLAPASVNINTADANAIASTLKGVGDARAQEIVRYREQYGPFASIDELTDVKGIGKSTLEDNRTRITLE